MSFILKLETLRRGNGVPEQGLIGGFFVLFIGGFLFALSEAFSSRHDISKARTDKGEESPDKTGNDKLTV